MRTLGSSKLSVIGAGKMGEAIISGLLKSGSYSPEDIQIFEVVKDRRDYIVETYHVLSAENMLDVAAFGDIVLVAVKPNIVAGVLGEIGHKMKPGRILVSIAAGVTLEFLRKHLPGDVPVVRAMPNLACSVGEAMIVVCPSENTSKAELNLAIDALSGLGKVLKLEEKYLNLATGLVGSGPAYIFLIIDALADAGVRLGLPKDISIKLAAQTTLGASKMVVETGEHPAKLKDMVATPAGTTVEGLLTLEQGKVRATLISAVTEASLRAQRLMSK